MKGIIYKITCNETGEVYYGSTTKSLNLRISQHKSACKRWKEGKCHFTTSYNIIDRGNYSYSLIETVECEDKKQLEAVERRYIENNECINKCVVGRTNKEWYKVNKEHRSECHKEYYEANKDAFKEYYEANKEAIKEYQRAHYEANKDKIKEQNQVYREANKEYYKERKKEWYLKQKLLKKTIE
jgi:hypothetical protein